MTVLPITAEMRSNFRHLYADVLWFGILAGSTMAFLAVYATRIGATGFQIGLLAAGPAAVNLFFSLPAGKWLEGRQLIRSTFWAAALHRFGYLALIPLPWFLSQHLEIWSIILITLVMSVPGTLLAIGFNAAFADVVPPEHRSLVVGRRNALVAVSLTLSTLLCGQILDRVIFPLNYQIVFVLGAVGAAVSTYHVGCLQLKSENRPLRIGRPIGDQARPGLMRFGDVFRLAVGLRFLTRSRGRSLLRLDLLRSSFGLFLGGYLAFYLFQNIPLSLFPLAYVRVLQLSDGAISLGSGLFYGTMTLISLRLPFLSTRYGHKRLLVVGALLFGQYPLLIGLAQNAFLYWLASLTGGAVWGITNAGLINRLMEQVPDNDRPAYMALHNLVMNVGILAGSMLGPWLGDWMGISEALIFSAGLRLVAGVLLAACS